jgi:hypothetical protein
MVNFDECRDLLDATLAKEQAIVQGYEQQLSCIHAACIKALEEGYIFGGIKLTDVPYKATKLIQKVRKSCVVHVGSVTIAWNPMPGVEIPWNLEEGDYYQAILNKGVTKSTGYK